VGWSQRGQLAVSGLLVVYRLATERSRCGQGNQAYFAYYKVWPSLGHGDNTQSQVQMA